MMKVILSGLLMLTLLAACNGFQQVQQPAGDVSQPLVRICAMQDRSGSINQTRTVTLTADQLRSLVDIVAETGGEFGFGIIGERSDLPLLRLPVKPLPPEPQKPSNPLLMKRWREKKGEWEALRTKRDEEVQAFIKAAEARLQTELASRTDVCGAIRRCDLMLAEPVSHATEDFMLLVTDGLHNVRQSPCPDALRSSARMIVVNGEGLMGILESYKPVRFEAVDAAIRYIRDSIAGGRRK